MEGKPAIRRLLPRTHATVAEWPREDENSQSVSGWRRFASEIRDRRSEFVRSFTARASAFAGQGMASLADQTS
jgi:hypothetical protein